MKKILFLQIIGNSYGGVWFVNKTIGEALTDYGYCVEILSVRDSHIGVKLEHNSKLKVTVVNERDKWEVPHFCDVKDSLKKLHFIKAIKLFIKTIDGRVKLKKDYAIIRDYIRKNNFDVIVTTHYQLLDAIPKEFYKKTIHEQHTSFKASFEHAATRRAFNKYNGKIKFIWLTNATCEKAKKCGYVNSVYIYNPVRFSNNKRANVFNNKKLIAITRLSPEKRIDLMIKIVNDVLKDKELTDWSLDIYGDGECKEELSKIDYDRNRIFLKGSTDDVLNVFMNSSINLNTSLFEGFAMGILEACECGVPTVTFNFGESVQEEIIQNKTGIYVEYGNIELFKKELKKLMKDEIRINDMSLECKKFSKNFQKEVIVSKWIKIIENL